MGEKIIALFLLLFLLIPLTSAEEFSIELKPHHYNNSKEILVYNNETKFDGISFEIIGKNFDNENGILNLTIVDSSPILFKEVLPENVIEMLRIEQSKTLWVSKIIAINKFNQTNISFWINVSGKHEKTNEVLYSEGRININLNAPEKNANLFYSVGNKIWEGYPTGGLLIVLAVVLIVSFFYWYYEGAKKLNKWRDEEERKKIYREKLEGGR